MNLPYDVFPLIFEHLPPPSLCALASVSATFHEAIVPLLYRSIDVRKPDQLLSTLSQRPERAVYVKRIGVGTVTSTGRRSNRGEYIEKVSRLLSLCSSLETLSIPHDLAAIALLRTGVLSTLVNLHSLELNLAALRGVPDNPAVLLDSAFAPGRTVHSLQLYSPPESVLTRIPSWLDSLRSLTELKFRDAYDLRQEFLRDILRNTPALRTLRLMRTLDAEVLGVLDLVPRLETLGVTVRNNAFASKALDVSESATHPAVALLPRLARLTLFLFSSDDPDNLEPAFRLIMQFLGASPLQHVSVMADSTIAAGQYRGPTPRFNARAIRALTGTHSHSLSRFTATVPLSESGLTELLRACGHLEYLSAGLPKNAEDILGISTSLRALTITSDTRQATSIGTRGVAAMAKACPSLRKVVRSPVQWTIKVEGNEVRVEPCVQGPLNRHGGRR
ncbi:hypothetical protein AURDEDRAFT_115069 [Auricularia subglabra TFB-10046 SS5]|nr:hypothetical protein AURDEDRAFT_115069 [Auricularia subglabra TFB-10046 SS5]